MSIEFQTILQYVGLAALIFAVFSFIVNKRSADVRFQAKELPELTLKAAVMSGDDVSRAGFIVSSKSSLLPILVLEVVNRTSVDAVDCAVSVVVRCGHRSKRIDCQVPSLSKVSAGASVVARIDHALAAPFAELSKGTLLHRTYRSNQFMEIARKMGATIPPDALLLQKTAAFPVYLVTVHLSYRSPLARSPTQRTTRSILCDPGQTKLLTADGAVAWASNPVSAFDRALVFFRSTKPLRYSVPGAVPASGREGQS